MMLVYASGQNHDARLGSWFCLLVSCLFGSWKNLFVTSLIDVQFFKFFCLYFCLLYTSKWRDREKIKNYTFMPYLGRVFGSTVKWNIFLSTLFYLQRQNFFWRKSHLYTVQIHCRPHLKSIACQYLMKLLE